MEVRERSKGRKMILKEKRDGKVEKRKRQEDEDI